MPAFHLPPPDPAFEITLSSQGMSQGLSQTDGIQIVPRAFVRLGRARIGAQWRNISSPTADGVLALFVRYRHDFDKGWIDAGIVYRIRTGANPSSDSEAWEFNVGARRSFGKLGLRLSADYAPQEFGSGRSLYVELGPSFDIAAVRLSANLGRRERAGGPDYTALNVGAGLSLPQGLTFDVRYYRTDRSRLGARFQDRLVLSVQLAL